MFKYPKVFQCDNEYEFKSSVIKLLKNRNADIKNKNKKIQENLHSFWGTFEKDSAEDCLQPMVAQELQILKMYHKFGLKF